MKTNIPTPLNRQELREAVAKAIFREDMPSYAKWKDLENIFLPLADAAIKAYEEFKSRIAKAGESGL